ncbi:CPBP family archaeomyxosortase MrtA [Thermococcus sp. 21S9]|uniref:CPBP family archaeomyxosortase MrtA n=1 Tax=Thermococcus sp. 21S9 TaxID=1638223 RepID=UPI00143A9CB0|nr:CPBP family archaeomyxosortase MrtA [Thermococcus sp. 21S9]NJE55365.1 CPBP family intramembrane metalloprotease [Thermococcus sp. 21S9]
MDRASLLYVLLFPLSFVPWLIPASFWEHVAVVLVAYLLVPLAISMALGFRPEELGLKPPNRKGVKLFLLFFALSIPLSLYGATIPSMRNYYPVFPYSGPGSFLLGELGMGLIMLAHEAFYRGFLLFPLARKNEWLAIVLQDIPYTLVHVGKPRIEVPYALVAGIIFAKMDLEGESFLPSFLLHWLGSAFFDVLCAL